MKKILMSIACFGLLFLTSCDEETTLGLSEVTVFPELELVGEAIMVTEIGQPFNDPGADATIGGESVPFETISDIDTNSAGFYTVEYSVVNDDGFTAAAIRTVIVYENDGSPAGVYDGIRAGRSGGPVLISHNGDGRFKCSDFLAGWYERGANNYGPAYTFPGIITIDTDAGIVTADAPSSPGGFGTITLSNGSISPDGKFMTWFGTLDNYAPFGFDTEYTKITP